MAEPDSLDDFFAKKDKSKKKGKAKNKVIASELPAVGSDKLTEEPRKKKKEKKAEQSETTEKPAEESEWKEFEDEKEKDYSDLKIQTMSIREEVQEAAKEAKEAAAAEKENRDGKVWSKKKGSESRVPPPETVEKKEAEPAPPSEPVESAPKAPAKYVPPSMRGLGGAVSSSTPANSRLRRKKEAPNLTSEVDFPTLGGVVSATAQGAWGSSSTSSGGGNFEEVRGTGFTQQQSRAAAQDVDVGNRFDLLSADQ